MAVWVQPGAVGRCQGRGGTAWRWGRGHDLGGTAQDRIGVAKTMGVQSGVVGGGQGPWGRGQDRGGATRGRWGAAKPVGAQPRPYFRG